MPVSALNNAGSSQPNQAAIDFIRVHLAEVNANRDDKISKDEITAALPLFDADERSLLTDFLNSQTFQDMDAADGVARGSFLVGMLGQASAKLESKPAPVDQPDDVAVDQPDDGAGNRGDNGMPPGSVPLDVSALANDDTTVDGDGVVTTTYRENTGADGDDPAGFNEKLSPGAVFPANEVVFHYQFKPDANFDWAKGGKLPGLQIGEGKASGGVHSQGAASARLMWKKDGEVIGYVYPMPGTDSAGLSQSDKFGNGLFEGEGLQLRTDDWNDVTVRVKLNTIDGNGNPNTDGEQSVTINGKTLTMTDIQWRLNDEQQITEALVVTFFGGPDNSPQTQNAQFKDFQVARLG